MELATFHWLLGGDGQALLAEAMQADLSDGARLPTLERLRRAAAPERAAAAYEIALLRQRAAAKFSRAAELYFTREALEQASGERIARYRAERFADLGRIADLGCGIGGDLIALAGVAHVLGVDRDPLRLAMAAANLRVYGLEEHAELRQADLAVAPFDYLAPDIAAIFFDPARRRGGRRIVALDEYEPPVELAARWRAQVDSIGIKVAPGVSDHELVAHGAGEVEFISLDGELKEAVLWYGAPARGGRRAALLTSAGAPPQTLAALPDALPALQSAPRAFLYEPDPAVIRAGLVGTLAAMLGAAQVDAQIAYLTADAQQATPYARCWRVLEWLPFSLKRLRARLRALDAGSVTVKKRGSPLDTDALARQLSHTAGRPLVVVLTRVADRPAALICEGPVKIED
jgi:SAM-dependent methyltransferase